MKIVNKILFKLHLKKRSHPVFTPSGQLPEPIMQVLNENGLDTDNIIYTFKTDMSNAETFGEVYVCFDEKGLYIAEFKMPEIDDKKKSKRKKNKKPEELSPVLLKLSSIPIDEIDEVFAE